jgi:hypothetical protein
MGEFFLIKSRHGTWLGVDEDSGRVVCHDVRGLGTQRWVLTGFVSAHRPNVCFLVAISAGVDRLIMPPGLECDVVLPLGLAPHPKAPTVSLYHPDTGRWVCALPPRDDADFAPTVADRETILAYEQFSLVPMQTEVVPPNVRAVGSRLDRILAAPLSPESILAMAPEDAPILQAVARTVPVVQLATLAQTLVGSAQACRKLAQMFPGDLIATLGLPSLATWIAWRSASMGELQNWRMTLGAEADGLADLGMEPDYISFPYACAALARRAVEPRRDVCLIATARNEGLYLLDWLAYHRAIGIESFFLYTNDNDDGSDDLLAALARGQAIHWVDSKVATGVSAPQFKAYGHALAVRPDTLDYRWALIIDLDEYLVLNPAAFTSVKDYLQWQEVDGVDAIALNWFFQGSCGHGKWQDEFIVRRFPSPDGPANPHIKTLCRPRKFIQSHPHFPLTYRGEPYIFKNSSAGPHVEHAAAGKAWSETPMAKFAWVNHYFYKSTEEFLLKWSRNRGDHPTVGVPTHSRMTAQTVKDFMAQFATRGSPVADPEAAAPGFAAERASLMALPGVADALARVKAAYHTRVKDIIPMYRDAPGIKEAGDVGQALLATLEQKTRQAASPDMAPQTGIRHGASKRRARRTRTPAAAGD